MATLSTFLPAFHPNCVFYEEGCYVTKYETGNSVLVVSPDGSIRTSDLETVFGVEIKCPFPGKTFTTPVQYALPARYVAQVLSQMNCLNVEHLCFVSYLEESTAIHKAENDKNLWNDIFVQILDAQQHKNPKQMKPEVGLLRKKVESYRQERVEFVAELPSVKAVNCTHSQSVNSRRNNHEKPSESSDNDKTILSCHKAVYAAVDLIRKCHKLAAQRATEVLVFMLCDLDRIYKPELPHAFPVGYGLKGYSMKTEAMRLMLKDVFKCLFQYGLYTPVVSYDGQWAKLAYQDEHGTPLTVIELQKQVYSKVMSKAASQLTKKIFETGELSYVSVDNINQKIYICKDNTGFILGHKDDIRLYKT